MLGLSFTIPVLIRARRPQTRRAATAFLYRLALTLKGYIYQGPSRARGDDTSSSRPKQDQAVWLQLIAD